MTPPSPTYCLRQSPAGFWYRIPFIYEYDWSQWCADIRARCDLLHLSYNSHLNPPMPNYAIPVHLEKLIFENPVEVG